MAIQKKIHQTAFNPKHLAPELRKNISQLKNLNPGWICTTYSHSDQKDYIRSHLPQNDFEELESLNPKFGVVLADLFRYLVIYNEGGVYLDIKSTAKRPLDEVLKPKHHYLISQWKNKLGDKFEGAGLHPELAGVPGGEFQQWHVIAEAKHPFLKAVVEKTLYNIRTYSPEVFGVGKIGVLRLSGPICYTQAIRPLLGHYPANIVDIEDLGFQYSIYEDVGDRDRHTRNSKHYSNVREPIILREKYFDIEDRKKKSLGDQLADVLRENTDLALKVALFSIVSTVVVCLLFISVIVWRIAR